MALDNKTSSIFRKMGLFGTSVLLALNMACVKYEKMNSNSNPALYLSGNGTSLKAEYPSGKKLHLESPCKIQDVLGQFHIDNYRVIKIKNPGSEPFTEHTPYGRSVCEAAYDALKRDMKEKGIADDIDDTIKKKAKVN